LCTPRTTKTEIVKPKPALQLFKYTSIHIRAEGKLGGQGKGWKATIRHFWGHF
jgi:hypothetical protein